MVTRQTAKVTLKNKGWSQRRAAEILGVSSTHLSLVLNGRRQSRRLDRLINLLPDSETPYMSSGFAVMPAKILKKTASHGGIKSRARLHN